MPRQIVTEDKILELIAQGQAELVVGPHDIVTDLAAETAQERGVRLVHAGETPAAPQARPAAPGSAGAARCTGADCEEVRRSVVAALGFEPPELDSVINKVLRGQ